MLVVTAGQLVELTECQNVALAEGTRAKLLDQCVFGGGEEHLLSDGSQIGNEAYKHIVVVTTGKNGVSGARILGREVAVQAGEHSIGVSGGRGRKGLVFDQLGRVIGDGNDQSGIQ